MSKKGYQMVVGWRDEPTFSGVRNAVQLFLSSADDAPVRDLGDGLTVQVVYAGKASAPKQMHAAFGATYGTPGEYDAALIPTRPTSYTFHFKGSIRGTPRGLFTRR